MRQFFHWGLDFEVRMRSAITNFLLDKNDRVIGAYVAPLT